MELSEVLSRDKLRGVTMVDTENLLTLAVAMQKAQEKDWLESYEFIGDVRNQPRQDNIYTSYSFMLCKSCCPACCIKIYFGMKREFITLAGNVRFGVRDVVQPSCPPYRPLLG